MGGFLRCFSREDADLMLPVVQWDSPVPRAGESMVLSPCVMVCSAMATRVLHSSRRGRCWLLLENTARFMGRGLELQGIALGALAFREPPALLGAGEQDKVMAGGLSQLHSSSTAP